MTDDAAITVRAGGYPLQYRQGTGRPLIVFHPFAEAASPRWIQGRGSHGGRPIAVFGARDMESFSAPADLVVQELLDATGWRGAEAVDLIGYSTGGFAALLYGALLSLARPATRVAVIGFSPLVTIWPMPSGPRVKHHDLATKAGLAEPGRRANLERFGDARPWIAKARAENEDRFSARILYASRNERDAAQAALLENAAGVTLVPMPTALHGYYRLVGLRASWEAEVEQTRIRLQAETAMEADEALEEATALQAAFATAAAVEPELFSIFLSRRRVLAATPAMAPAAS